MHDEPSILKGIPNTALVKESESSFVNYAAKSESATASSTKPNIELDSYLLNTVSIRIMSESEGLPLGSSFLSSSNIALTVDSSLHWTEPVLLSHSPLSSQVPLTLPSISRSIKSLSSFPSELIVTPIMQLSTQSESSSIPNGAEQRKEMTMEAAQNSEIVFTSYGDFSPNKAVDDDFHQSSNDAQNNRTFIRSPLHNDSEMFFEYVSLNQNPFDLESSFVALSSSAAILKTARELQITETPKLALFEHTTRVTENENKSQMEDLTVETSSKDYISSVDLTMEKNIISTPFFHKIVAAFGNTAATSSEIFSAASNQHNSDAFFGSEKSQRDIAETSDEMSMRNQDEGISSSEERPPSNFQKRNGFVFTESENEDGDNLDIHLEGSLEDSEKNMATHSSFQFSNLQTSFTSYPAFSTAGIETSSETEKTVVTTADLIEKRSDSGEQKHLIDISRSSHYSQPSFMYLKQVSEYSKLNIGKSNATKSDMLIVVSPSSQRTNKEIVLKTEEPSPTLNEDEVSKIVSILTGNLPELSTEDILASESLLQFDVNNSSAEKNKTSRDDTPHFDDIISGIIQLLAGDISVPRPPPNFQLAHPPIPRPPRPTSSRINNRGPPALFPPSKTVVVFSQPPHHVNVRPRPPPPIPRPPVRPRPSLTRINHFQTAPAVTHIINVVPARPEKVASPTTSIIHLYKPLLNPLEGETYGHLPIDEDTIISVLKSIPMLSAAKPNTVLTKSPTDRLIESSKKTSAPEVPQVYNTKKESGILQSHTPSGSSATSTTEDPSGPFVYDDYYDDVSESEESTEDKTVGTTSNTFEILKDPTPKDIKNFSDSEANDEKASTEENLQPVSSNQGIVSTSGEKTSGDKYLYVSTKVLPKGSHMPSGPITDWVPFFERPASKPFTGSGIEGHPGSSKGSPVPEIVIITEPTMFDLTVTNALTGVHSPSSTSNSSQLLEITPSSTVNVQQTKPEKILDTGVQSSSPTKIFMTPVLPSHPQVTTTVADKEIYATVRMKSPATDNKSQQTASLSPSEPEIVYGRPSSSQEKPVSPLRVDILSKYRHNPSLSDTFSKTELSETLPAEETVTLVGKASLKPGVTSTPINSTSVSVLSTPSPQPQHSTSGPPLLGRPIVVPVDIEEVRPYVGAINPPRQGARPSLNGGQRSPPGFPGPPNLGSGNVQVAQAGVNVADDTRGRPSAIRPSQTSRPPLIRTPPRLRTNTPLVRIDTCIVGDDSTCDLQMNETCKTEHGVSSCQCRPGFARSFPRGPCQPIVSIMLSLKVDRFGDQRISFNPRYQDPNSEEYRLMEFEAKQALSSLFAYTAFSRNFVSATVNKFYSIGGRLIINSTIQLEEKESTRVQSLRLQMRQEVVQAINSKAQNIGDSRLYVEGPLNPVPAVEDVNECTDPALNDCSENGYCSNIFGTYLCKCKVGYLDSYPYEERKSGRKCSACSVDYCSNHGHCYVENGQKLCRCRGNYIGSRCEIDSEVLGVALGASLAAIIIIVLTLVCLCIWNRRWKREQQKTEAMSARSVNSAQTYSYLNKMSNLNTYRLTMEDRMRWAHIADVVGNVYVQPEAGATPMQTSMVQANQSAYPTMTRCHSPSSDETTWYGYNTTRPRSRAANCHNQPQGNGNFYDTDFSTRETYVAPGYAPISRFVTPNVIRNYYS